MKTKWRTGLATVTLLLSALGIAACGSSESKPKSSVGTSKVTITTRGKYVGASEVRVRIERVVL